MADLVSARAATSADLAALGDLLQAAELAVREERGGRWLLDHDRRALDDPSARHRSMLESTGARVIVGCIDRTVVGYALAELSATNSGTLCMIEELIVAPDARAVGVGSAMLEAVIEWAIENECQAIESQVLPGNRAAKNFFERLGMKTRKMRVSRDLSG